MIKNITIAEYLQQSEPIALADVRTPAEFEQGHIPGAFNLPIFSNEERVEIGTTYKQIGREEAILLGFDFTGSKWRGFIEDALKIAPNKKIVLHCWRGGMRSGTMAWALDLYGFEVFLIIGGYKSYRTWTLQLFEKSYDFCILGGMTGSRKTLLLKEFSKSGAQVIDLEDLAQHQGSAYGSMNKMIQPSQEQFENNLAFIIKDLDANCKIWLEDESGTIGRRAIPRNFWLQMQNANLFQVEVDLEQRIDFLVQEYGFLDKDFLIERTERIKKRLGPEQTKNAVAAIAENRMSDFIKIVLVYYDKTYTRCILKRNEETTFTIPLKGNDLSQNAQQILNFSTTIKAPQT